MSQPYQEGRSSGVQQESQSYQQESWPLCRAARNQSSPFLCCGCHGRPKQYPQAYRSVLQFLDHHPQTSHRGQEGRWGGLGSGRQGVLTSSWACGGTWEAVSSSKPLWHEFSTPFSKWKTDLTKEKELAKPPLGNRTVAFQHSFFYHQQSKEEKSTLLQQHPGHPDI